MTRERTVGEQVRSGFRIAGLVVLAFAFFVALTWAAMFSLGGSGNLTSNSHRILGSFALVALAFVLFFTTRYWAKWVLGIVCYCLVRTLFGAPFFVLFGKTDVAEELAFIAAYSAVALLLTWRHFQREPRGMERFGLVAFVICAPVALALQSYMPLLAGLAFLGVGELVGTMVRSGRKRIGGHGDSPTQIV
jgi:hypothetical protein